uniref:unspecific monooxygenase n=1 Tax=Mythimna separata TaxID=271217 RepID=A0A7G3WA75_MYTSE|nr:cytochrome P450 CYP9A101 [Mythimna separata]
MILILVWVAVLIAVLVLYFQQIYSRFSRYGVKHITPVPLFGNMARLIFRLEHFTDNMGNLYRSFPEEKFVGRFEFLNEMVMIRDVELIKRIGVKDFEHFLDHRSLFSSSDTFFNRNLFSLKGQEWKDMRSTLSPAFTSSKMRLMVPFMVEVGDQMMISLRQKIKNSKSGYIDLECKDLTTRYANDVIASCAFGLKVDSHNDVDNEFYAMGKVSSTFTFRQMLMFFLIANAPKLAKALKLDVLSEAAKQFFRKLVLETMSDRETRNIVRPDMIHLLMESKKGKLTHEDIKSNDEAAGFATVEEYAVGKKKNTREWADKDLVAQAFLFLIAGFETVSSSMSFLLYELAVNPDVQERLVQEIREHDAKNGGLFDFNSIQNMTYLDMVVSEVLRLWPPAIASDRVCNRDYNLGKPNETAEKDFILRKGAAIMIPTFAIHRDPEFFPEPEKFNPDRFSEENKHKINVLAYMPFGLGPRNCIGSRFALCELKVMVYQLLRHMEVSPCVKTCIPAKLATDNFNFRLQGGHWLRFRLRK